VTSAAPHEPALTDWLRERLGSHVRRDVTADEPLAEWGLSSVALLGFYGDIEQRFGPVLDPSDLWAHPTLRDLAGFLAARSSESAADDDGRAATAFVFTGQGSQHSSMTAALHRDWTAYRRRLDEADAALAPHLGGSVVDLVLGGDERVHRTALTQPALFAVGYALATTLTDEGVRPVAVLGHGVGEYAAAVVAGALDLRDAARLVCLRGRCTQHLPSGGGMLAACADPLEAAEAIAGEAGVWVAAVNAARATVLSGRITGLRRTRERLAAVGIASRFLRAEHAFQSPLMEPASPAFEEAARRLPPGTPEVRFYSTVYGRAYDGPLDAAYWARHLTSPVRFADAARALLAQQTPGHVVEIGPKPVLTPFVRRMASQAGPVCVPVCHGPDSDGVALAGVLSALDAGRLAER
jgi:[acyl-carrier-protein] S-malonyltransferase